MSRIDVIVHRSGVAYFDGVSMPETEEEFKETFKDCYKGQGFTFNIRPACWKVAAHLTGRINKWIEESGGQTV
jgi:hypothetical protein